MKSYAAVGLVLFGLLGCNGAKAKLDEAQALENKGDYKEALTAYEAVVKATEKEPDSEPSQTARKKIVLMNAALAAFTEARQNVTLLAKDLSSATEAEAMGLTLGEPAKKNRCPPMAKPLPASLSAFSMKDEGNPLSFYGQSPGENKNPTFTCAKFDLPFGRMYFQYQVAEPDPKTVEVAARRPLPDGKTWEYKVVGHYDDKGSLRLTDPQESRK